MFLFIPLLFLLFVLFHLKCGLICLNTQEVLESKKSGNQSDYFSLGRGEYLTLFLLSCSIYLINNLLLDLLVSFTSGILKSISNHTLPCVCIYLLIVKGIPTI